MKRRLRVLLVTMYYPAPKSLVGIAKNLNILLTSSEEQKEVLPKPSIIELSTNTPFRLRFDNYKACCRMFVTGPAYLRQISSDIFLEQGISIFCYNSSFIYSVISFSFSYHYNYFSFYPTLLLPLFFLASIHFKLYNCLFIMFYCFLHYHEMVVLKHSTAYFLRFILTFQKAAPIISFCFTASVVINQNQYVL